MNFIEILMKRLNRLSIHAKDEMLMRGDYDIFLDKIVDPTFACTKFRDARVGGYTSDGRNVPALICAS